ncbi:hypothetical protein IAT40_000242 [Kwoniella sp. CBS 6097]
MSGRPPRNPGLFLAVWNNDVIRDIIVAHLDQSEIRPLLPVSKNFRDTLLPLLYHTCDPDDQRKLRGYDGEQQYDTYVRTIDLTFCSRINDIDADHWLEAFQSFDCATTLITKNEVVTRKFTDEDEPYYTLKYHKEVTVKIHVNGLEWERVGSSFGISEEVIDGFLICTTVSFLMKVDPDIQENDHSRWWPEIARGMDKDIEQHDGVKITGLRALGFHDNKALLDTFRSFEVNGAVAIKDLELTQFDAPAIQIINLCRRTINNFDFTGTPLVSLKELVHTLRMDDLPRIYRLKIGCLPRRLSDTFDIQQDFSLVKIMPRLFDLTFVTTCNPDASRPKERVAEVDFFRQLPHLLSRMFRGGEVDEFLTLSQTEGIPLSEDHSLWDECFSAFDAQAAKVFICYIKNLWLLNDLFR